MFLPYRDDNPTRRFAWMTLLLILANGAAFFYQVFGAGEFDDITGQFGLIPAELASGRNLPNSVYVSPFVTQVTYMFCHGGVSHLGFNMLFLWIFGNNVEDRLGRLNFLFFYLVIGILSGLAFVIASPGLETPLVGASGAISGILGAYLIMFPFARIYVWMIFFVVRMPALVFLPIWFVMQISGLMGSAAGAGGGVAWISHIAGFVAGMLLFKLFERNR